MRVSDQANFSPARVSTQITSLPTGSPNRSGGNTCKPSASSNTKPTSTITRAMLDDTGYSSDIPPFQSVRHSGSVSSEAGHVDASISTGSSQSMHSKNTSTHNATLSPRNGRAVPARAVLVLSDDSDDDVPLVTRPPLTMHTGRPTVTVTDKSSASSNDNSRGGPLPSTKRKRTSHDTTNSSSRRPTSHDGTSAKSLLSSYESKLIVLLISVGLQ